jgi:hypothetical protein
VDGLLALRRSAQDYSRGKNYRLRFVGKHWFDLKTILIGDTPCIL